MSNKRKIRLKHVSFEAVQELIKLACEERPMIALGIALQSFAGLKTTEVINVSLSDIERIYLDRIAKISPKFMPLFQEVLEFHNDYIKNRGIKNECGAVLLNRDGFAMHQKSYNDNFKFLIKKLIPLLQESGNIRFMEEAQKMIEFEFQPITLRYFYLNTILNMGEVINHNVTFRPQCTNDMGETTMRYYKKNVYKVND
jgi:integrase